MAEPLDHIRRKCCHTIAELVTTCYRSKQSWPELFTVIAAAPSHPLVPVRSILLTLARRVFDYVGKVCPLLPIIRDSTLLVPLLHEFMCSRFCYDHSQLSL